MAGSIQNNNSAEGSRTVSWAGVYTVGGHCQAGASQYTTGATYQYFLEVNEAAGPYRAQFYTENSVDELRFYSNETGELTIASGSPTTWGYCRFVKTTTTTAVAEYLPNGSSTWTTIASFAIANSGATSVYVFRSVDNGFRCVNGRMRSVGAWEAALSQAESLAEATSTTPVRTSNLYAYWAGGATPVAATWGNDTSGNGNHLTVAGTAVYDAADPVAPSGITLTGQSAGITTSRGNLGIGLGLTGQSAGIATTAGVLGNLWALSGQNLGLAATVGAFVPAPAQSVTGRSAGIAANAGTLANQGAQSIGGQSVGIATQAGVLGNSGAIAGAQAGIAAAAGNLGVLDAQALGGQAAGIATQTGVLGRLHTLTGQAAGIAANAGALGVSDAQALAGQLVSIAATAGSLASSDVLLGRSLGIATQAGNLGPSGAEPVLGQVLGIAVAAGTLGPAGTQTVTGYSTSIAAAAGTVGASQAGDANPSGQSLGISTTAGSLGLSGAVPLTGASAAIAASYGNLGGGQVVLGQSLGISAVSGNLGPATGLPLLGRFVGIATQAGAIAQPGESVTRTLDGFAIGIGAFAGALTWVDYGPPVDYAYVQSKIIANDAIYQFAVSGVWRSKATTDSSLPETFPYRAQLAAVGYLSVRQVKAALILDLVVAGFTVAQAETIVTAAEKL